MSNVSEALHGTSDPLASLREAGPGPALESEAFGEWVLGQAGLSVPDGIVTVAPDPEMRRVPWARQSDWIILPSPGGTTLAPLANARVRPAGNLAGEERDAVTLEDVEPFAHAPLDQDVVRLRGTLVRAVLMAGALERIRDLSLSHARERVQFRRAIGSFQAVQAHLVTIAQQAALAGVAADAAVATGGAFEIAAAKLLADRAAVTATRAAHQIHGAVGVTREHPLSLHTRRLWAWRAEYGDERAWSARLGAAAGRVGADRLYPAITGGSAELEV
jgi:acyl-CoA dehydrogenase